MHLGKESNNDYYSVDLSSLPHLVISYSEKEQLHYLFSELLAQLSVGIFSTRLDLAYVGPVSFLPEYLATSNLKSSILKDDAGNMGPETRLGFLSVLHELMKMRQKMRKKEGPDKFTPLVIFIDDLLDLVITRNKKTGTYFLNLFRNGPAQHIHFIIGSIRSYRNLIRQLLYQGYTGSLHGTNLRDNDVPFEALAAELIITPEDLLFYKKAEELNYHRLFLLSEGNTLAE